MLLNYISSGLPELDVNNVSQMRMDKFIPYLMGKTWIKKYRLTADKKDAPVRSKLPFILSLEQYLQDFEHHYLRLHPIIDSEIGSIFTTHNMEEIRSLNPQLSLFQFEKLLNDRISARIKSLCYDFEPEQRREKLKQYKKYFNSEKHKWTALQIYMDFLHTHGYDIEGTTKGRLDIYDAAAMALIYRRILMKKADEEFSQIIIDEAQDFGETAYYVLKQLLPDCYFTIMGDVSQNIHFETGLNEWTPLTRDIFSNTKDSFYLLSKSYRNTIEISQCAGKVLDKASQGSYKIQPVIRHGQAVQTITVPENILTETLTDTIEKVKAKGFETIAVICRTEDEAQEVAQYINIEETDNDQFKNGVMVLPVSKTKGLEFDAVILWKPDDAHYGMNKKEAKLLYVAITRALHELYMIGDNIPSQLLY